MSHPTRREFLERAVALAAAGGVGLPARSAATRAALVTGGGPDLLRRTGSTGAVLDVAILGGRVVDPAAGIAGPRDVGIAGGRVARVAERIAPEEADTVLDARGRLVVPGLIDVHAHLYEGVAFVGIDADQVGIGRGVTTAVDGGSAGATTLAGFRSYVVERARTRVYALLNLASPGMTVPNETADLAFLDPDAAARAIEGNRDVVVGLKVRMLAGIPPGQDLEVMRRARAAADAAGVPVVVHIGGQTSPLPRVIEHLRPGDVITHALRGRGSILAPDGRVYPEVVEAVRGGVHLDVGHGRGNLDFDVAERILDQGVLPTTISSDVHRGNAFGPVFDLPTTLAKFVALGMTIEQVVERATAAPARIFGFGLPLGTLREGSPADVSVFELVEGERVFVDSGGKTRTGTLGIVPYATLRDGRP